METSEAKGPALMELKANLDYESYKRHYWFLTRTPFFWILWLIPLLFILPYFFTRNLGQLVVSVVFLAYIAIFFIPGPRRAYRRLSQLDTESDIIYTFYPDDFQVTYSGELSTSTQTVRYEYIKAAYETKHTFYLQPVESSPSDYILDKKHFTPEQMEALRELFAQQLGEKFKGMKAKKQEA